MLRISTSHPVTFTFFMKIREKTFEIYDESSNFTFFCDFDSGVGLDSDKTKILSNPVLISS